MVPETLPSPEHWPVRTAQPIIRPENLLHTDIPSSERGAGEIYFLYLGQNYLHLP